MVSARQLIPDRFYNGVIPRNGCVASEEKNKTGNLQKTVWRHTLEAPKEGDVMRTSRTKYTTRAGLCAMALVLAAALVLAGCEQEPPARQETQLEKDIKNLAGKIGGNNGSNSGRGPALPPNNHNGGNWPSTTGNPSGGGRGNAAPKK